MYRASYELLGLRLDGDDAAGRGSANLSLAPSTQVVLGTPITRGNVGAMLRIGRGVPVALVPRIPAAAPPPFSAGEGMEAPAVLASAPPPPAPTALELRQEAAVKRLAAERPRHASERPAYVFVGGAVNGVLLNDFIQGTHLGARDDNPVIDIEMNRSFTEWEAGATVALPIWIIGAADISVRRVWRGAEFQGGPEHRFWALSIAW
jgi:hypothetical protein